jgi:NhaP-type Na+/H+ or K+/H+ antiporter
MSYICESLILVYFGLSFDHYFLQHGFGNVIGKRLLYGVADFFCMLFLRFATIFLLVGIVWLCKRKKDLSLSIVEIGLVGFSGMIRGSIAYALIVKLFPPDEESHDLGEPVFIAQTVIGLTMYIFTPLNPWLFNKLLPPSTGTGSLEGAGSHAGEGSVARPPSRTVLLQQRDEILKPKDKITCIDYLKRAELLFIKPLLIRDFENRRVGCQTYLVYTQG